MFRLPVTLLPVAPEDDVPAGLRGQPSHAQGTFRLSVVVPAYGDGHRIADTVGRLRSDLAGLAEAGGLEVVVVDDGSADDTAAAARRAGADQVLVLRENRGKGAAVRTGMLAARGRTIAFTDVDLSYAPSQLTRFVDEVESGADMVVGSRLHRDAETLVHASMFRRAASRLFNVLAFVVIGEYRDTQCGLKAFRADSARLLFSSARIDGFAFDVELFQLARRCGLRVVDVPVTLSSDDSSSVNLRGELKAVRDLARIWARRGKRDVTGGAARVSEPEGRAAGPQ